MLYMGGALRHPYKFMEQDKRIKVVGVLSMQLTAALKKGSRYDFSPA